MNLKVSSSVQQNIWEPQIRCTYKICLAYFLTPFKAILAPYKNADLMG